MDSGNQQQPNAAELRSRRLQYLLEQQESVQEHERNPPVEPSESSIVDAAPVPVASSTMLSSAPAPAPTAATTGASAASTTAGGSLITSALTSGLPGTTALVLVQGEGVKELLKALSHLLAQDAVIPATASNVDSAPVGAASLGALKKKPAQGTTASNSVQVISDGSNSSAHADDKELVKRPQSRRPIHFDWRNSLPSTSAGGFGDVKNFQSKKKRGGQLVTSKTRNAELNLSDSGTADDPAAGYDSSYDEVQKPVKRSKCNQNWRETTAAASGAIPKRRPGRPKGSKNKAKLQSSCAAESTSSLTCHICREGQEGGAFCLTDCGHLFHKKCIDRWLLTSNQKYRNQKTCPYCGGNFSNCVPFFG